MSAASPVIGICAARRAGALERLGRRGEPLAAHLHATSSPGRRAGGDPAARRRDRRATPARRCDLLDALILAGGADLDPAQLRAEPHARDDRTSAPSATASSSRWRARRSSATCRCSGICRGMQILNVARGGTLDQHLADRRTTHLPHPRRVRRPRGPARARARSRRARSAPSASTVRSHHHQGVERARRGARRQRLRRRGRGHRGDRAARSGCSRSASSGTPRRRTREPR